MSVRHTAVTTAPVLPAGDEELVCDIREVVQRIGDRWSVLVIVELAQGVRRFRQLQRAVPGISQRMLTLTLRRLERDALVDRTVYPTVPAQVEYELTDTGHSLTFVLKMLADWGAEHRDTVMESRARWDAKRPDADVHHDGG
ncbi:helix-turn-helix domain-containing protein [Streptomyces lunalinharesii]|uniref:Helix-turn-helix domain-containing protein n=1 Tax=Streptomyces lunalinharesii TaxID=333384 RepID=A0ABN3SRP3_9ACTN